MRAHCALSICVYTYASACMAADVRAEPPLDLAVTVYRAPARSRGSIDLDNLNGFALVSETRMVRLPAGESRLSFEGVADGIEAQSTIISGLPQNLVEKNHDASVLSPSALLAATVGKSVQLLRTNRKSGKTERLAGTILSDAGGGVIFQTSGGIEALRCSGLPESFSFEPGAGPSPRASLSVLVHTSVALTRKITLTYLSRGFDWAADYSATLSADERSMDLGAWVTVANSNGAGFPFAHVEVVAGRVNREDGAVDPIDIGGPILANCWPRGSTSDTSPSQLRFAPNAAMRSLMADATAAQGLQQITVSASRRVTEEQLGDLKLYRVPERSTVASRQSKQVRLFDRFAIPVKMLYRATLTAEETRTSFAAERLLRTVNDQANHLGLPLPSGSVAVFSLHEGQRLLLHESGMRDLAVNEKVDVELGSSAAVQIAPVHEEVPADAAPVRRLPLVPGAILRTATRLRYERVQVSNARAVPIQVELRVALYDGGRVTHADHRLGTSDGQPTFKLTVPAEGSVTLRYQIQYQAQSDAR